MKAAKRTIGVRLWPSVQKGALMTRFAIALVMALLLMPLAEAQSDSATTTDPNEVSADVGTFSVSGGTPGSWIQAALARHAAFVAARVNAARNGETPGVRWTSSTTSTTTGTTTTSDTSSNLSTELTNSRLST